MSVAASLAVPGKIHAARRTSVINKIFRGVAAVFWLGFKDIQKPTKSASQLTSRYRTFANLFSRYRGVYLAAH